MLNNIEFAERCYQASKLPTLYVMGGWGQPLTAANKIDFIDRYPYNERHSSEILNAPVNTFAFDCVCFIKSILDGFTGDVSKRFGGATYGQPVPDISCSEMINACSDISTSFKQLSIGEILYLKTNAGEEHVGVVVSVSPALAAECTPKWASGVQISSINRDVSGYPRRDWQRHGKLSKYVLYDKKPDQMCSVEMPTVIQGSVGPAVMTLQILLLHRGYSVGKAGVDGKAGAYTISAVKRFQAEHTDLSGQPLEVDGKVMALTWGSILRGDY